MGKNKGMIIVQKTIEENPKPLTWHKVDNELEERIFFTCPNGHTSLLEDLIVPWNILHHVNKKGKVRPSVICFSKGCKFHDFITLQDWTS